MTQPCAPCRTRTDPALLPQEDRVHTISSGSSRFSCLASSDGPEHSCVSEQVRPSDLTEVVQPCVQTLSALSIIHAFECRAHTHFHLFLCHNAHQASFHPLHLHRAFLLLNPHNRALQLRPPRRDLPSMSVLLTPPLGRPPAPLRDPARLPPRPLMPASTGSTSTNTGKLTRSTMTTRRSMV